jgi:hypothetical protein
MRHVLGGITRPALQRIENHHAQGMVVLTRKEVADQSPVIGPVLVRLPPCRSAAEILQHQVHVPIEPIGTDRWRVTHTQLPGPGQTITHAP